jgi:pSer/pThr/pTyr-binding forkhead associated (FHA) protein
MNAIFCESCGMPLRALGADTGGMHAAGKAGSGPLRAILLEIASGRTAEFHLGNEALILGRANPSVGLEPALDLTPDGGVEAGVSRRHARLSLKGGQVLLEDLGSTNGTWVNQTRLVPRQPVALNHGDVIRLGRLSLTVRLMTQRGDSEQLDRGR